MYITGFAGGGHFNNYGSVGNYLCLPPDPIWGKSFPNQGYAYLYGSEYDATGPLLGLTDPDDVPCAVCRSQSSVTTMMLPGRNQCYVGWKTQYNGYLAASHDGQRATKNYICLDQSAEALQAGSHNDDGAVLYLVQAKCGSLACPPYKDNAHITCVVCTK